MIRRIRILQRYVSQEGVASFLLRAIAGIAKSICHIESAYILERFVDSESVTLKRPDDVVVSLLNVDDMDQLSEIAYCEPSEIMRRFRAGQRCIVAKLDGSIVHYSWLTLDAEYAGEIEMMIPVKENEAYLYNCRTLAQARGLGIFPAAISDVIIEAGKSGISNVIALVSRNNKSSLRAFEKMHFVVKQEVLLIKFLAFRKHRIRQYKTI